MCWEQHWCICDSTNAQHASSNHSCHASAMTHVYQQVYFALGGQIWKPSVTSSSILKLLVTNLIKGTSDSPISKLAKCIKVFEKLCQDQNFWAQFCDIEKAKKICQRNHWLMISWNHCNKLEPLSFPKSPRTNETV
jgi:hypothetical protein